MENSGVPARRGRPREFDVDGALDAAMRLFWTRGYEATTMSDLVEALDLNRASLYAAFGGKEALFIKVLDRYARQFSSRPLAALTEFEDAREAIRQFLERTAEHLTDPHLPRGCLFTNTILEAPGGPEPICRMMTDGLGRLEGRIYDVLRRAQVERAIPAETDARALARFFVGTSQGMAALARLSGDPSTVRDMARVAMTAWPTPAAAA